MKLLLKTDDLFLYLTQDGFYKLYKVTPASPSGELKLNTEIAKSTILCKAITSHFTKQQIQTIKNKIHAMRYVNRKFTA